MSEKKEKPATRPHWLDESEWNDTGALKRKRDELQKKIRIRQGDQFQIEELIADSGQLSKRMRELDPPFEIPIDGNGDNGVRLHALPVHQRALRMAEHSRDSSAHAATSIDTGVLDRAALRVRTHARSILNHPDTERPKAAVKES